MSRWWVCCVCVCVHGGAATNWQRRGNGFWTRKEATWQSISLKTSWRTVFVSRVCGDMCVAEWRRRSCCRRRPGYKSAIITPQSLMEMDYDDAHRRIIIVWVNGCCQFSLAAFIHSSIYPSVSAPWQESGRGDLADTTKTTFFIILRQLALRLRGWALSRHKNWMDQAYLFLFRFLTRIALSFDSCMHHPRTVGFSDKRHR